jgi:hypothetical protein
MPQELAGRSAQHWGDRFLVDCREQSVHTDVAGVVAEDLGEGDAADMDRGAEALSEAELGTDPGMTLGTGAERV